MADQDYRDQVAAAWTAGDPCPQPADGRPPPPFVQPHLTRRQAEALAKHLRLRTTTLAESNPLRAALRNIERALEWRPDQPTPR